MRRRILRWLVAVVVLLLACLCGFGVLACADDWTNFWPFAVGYAIVGLASLVLAAALALKK